MDPVFNTDSAGSPLALALFKAEGLADYRKRHGARTADAALHAVQSCLHHAFRGQAARRRGDDEFAVPLPGVHLGFAREGAMSVLQARACLRLRGNERYVAAPRLQFGGAQALKDGDKGALVEPARADLSRCGEAPAAYAEHVLR